MQNFIETTNYVLGWLAAFLTVFVGIPQAWKTFRKKTVEAVSLPTFVLYYIGTIFWIVYVSLTPNKFLPLGITDILSCFVLTITLVLIYKYTYISKQRQEINGEKPRWGFFQSRVKPFVFAIVLFGLYVLYFILFLVCFVYKISVQGKLFKYTSLSIAFAGVAVVFVHQILTTFKKKSVEGLSFGIVTISLILNLVWEITWILRLVLIKNYGIPDFVSKDPTLTANLVEELFVGGSFQMVGVVVFLIQTIAYIIYNDWNFSKKKKV